MSTTRLYARLNGGHAKLADFEDMLVRKFEANRDKYLEDHAIEHQFHKPHSEVLSAIQEVSESEEVAAKHPAVAAEIKLARDLLFHHHETAIDFQLPQPKIMSAKETRQESYNNMFRACR